MAIVKHSNANRNDGEEYSDVYAELDEDKMRTNVKGSDYTSLTDKTQGSLYDTPNSKKARGRNWKTSSCRVAVALVLAVVCIALIAVLVGLSVLRREFSVLRREFSVLRRDLAGNIGQACYKVTQCFTWPNYTHVQKCITKICVSKVKVCMSGYGLIRIMLNNTCTHTHAHTHTDTYTHRHIHTQTHTQILPIRNIIAFL